jgi:hypothetical protein
LLGVLLAAEANYKWLAGYALLATTGKIILPILSIASKAAI